MFLLSVWVVALATALTSALSGIFVVLRQQSMLIDGLGHAVFPGIVLGYFFTRDLQSPLLLLGATIAGLVVVVGTEWLKNTGLVAGDAPLGLVFPALFAVGVIIVSSEFASLHLDTHTVLVGDLNLVAFDRLVIGGLDLGPTYLYIMLAVLLFNVVVLAALWPQLVISTFDPDGASVLGIRRGLIHGVYMLIVALTVTAAFYAAGALLVIALVIAPAATAQVFCTRLAPLTIWTLVIAAVAATSGFFFALVLNVATSATMAVIYGLIFAVVLAVHHWRSVRVSAKVPRTA